MKKSIIIFAISGFVLASVILWQMQSAFSNDVGEALQFAVIIVLVGFGVYYGVQKYRSSRAGEPDEDEMTKKVLVKAEAISFKVSMFLWLVLMYVAGKGIYEVEVIFGGGILGMGVIFVLSVLVLSRVGIKE